MSLILAIDIGGTQLRVAVYPPSSTIPLNVKRTATRGKEEGVFDRLTALIDSVWPEETVDAIAVAYPGPLDPKRGIILSTPNIPAWANFPLVELLEKRYKVPTYLGNDANLAALGEWRYGAGQDHNDLLYLTISTGIGGGVISDGRLLTGHSGMATELGHITILPDGPVCSCGRRGHLEAIASGTAIARYAYEQVLAGRTSSLSALPRITARDVSNAAIQGDPLSIETFNRAGKYLGQAVADFLHMFNPSIVIFGGGVSQSGALLFDPMKTSMSEHVMNPSYLEGLQIATAKLGDDAGLYGALTLAQIKLAQS